ncbi:MAG: hypothetical protein IIW75_06385 [Bacteroidaceae bacterium]|nr:hypothetical protein [Bacteroidaceae bacterium]
MSEENKKEKKRKGGMFTYLLGGGFLTSSFLTKNAMLLGLIVVYCFFYVSNRYQHERELVKIDKLKKRRNEIRNNLLVVESEFAYQCRIAAIEEKLGKGESGFSIPYIIDNNE